MRKPAGIKMDFFVVIFSFVSAATLPQVTVDTSADLSHGHSSGDTSTHDESTKSTSATDSKTSLYLDVVSSKVVYKVPDDVTSDATV